MLGNVYLGTLCFFAINFGQTQCRFFGTVLGFLTGPQEPETNMNAAEIIAFHGYPVETHTVITKDGYILNHHRIPHGKSGPSQPRKRVILQHGIMCSSVSWLLNTPDNIPPFLLADEGYDVWLTNIRGNEYCLKHTTLDSSSREFWNFSWTEMAKYDMPDTVDYILKTTGDQAVVYVGHSMGTTIGFAMLSFNPEYNAKIEAIFAFAPVAFVGNAKGLVVQVSSGLPIAVFHLLNHGELPFDYLVPTWLIDTVCAIPFTSRICVKAVLAGIGDDWPQFNQSRLDLYLRAVPTSTSVKVLEHYGQMIISKRFAMFDYNFDNQKFYNQSSPPDVDIGKITVPVALFWAENDWLSTPKDIETLASKLKNVVLNKKIDFPGFGHMDFLIANDVVRLVYTQLIDAMRLFIP